MDKNVLYLTAEILGVVSGILYVWLTARANILCWPAGLLNIASYIIVFYEAKLYADMGLQGIYIVLTVYGWVVWRHGDGNVKKRKISNVPRVELLAAAVAVAIIWLCVWHILHTYTDGEVTWADSFLMAASCGATWLAARKYIANWVWWIIIDTLYTPLYLYKQLYLTAALYVLFGIIAWRGYNIWRVKSAEVYI